MGEEFKVPSVRELDSSARDYAQKLDDGLTRACTKYSEQMGQLTDLQRSTYDQMFAEIRAVPGIKVDELPEVTEQLRAGEGLIGKFDVKFTMVSAESIDAGRGVEDLIRRYERSFGSQAGAYVERSIALGRAASDFMSAILSRTEVRPLNAGNIDNLHFYVLHGGGVYEAHSDGESVIGPTKNDNLKVGDFEDPTFLRAFSAETSLGRAYLVSNLSRIIPVEATLVSGIMKLTEQATKARASEESKKRSSVEELIASVKNGARKLKQRLW